LFVDTALLLATALPEIEAALVGGRLKLSAALLLGEPLPLALALALALEAGGPVQNFCIIL
jgi:hypothetical protein